jgi:hypothetical protein
MVLARFSLFLTSEKRGENTGSVFLISWLYLCPSLDSSVWMRRSFAVKIKEETEGDVNWVGKACYSTSVQQETEKRFIPILYLPNCNRGINSEVHLSCGNNTQEEEDWTTFERKRTFHFRPGLETKRRFSCPIPSSLQDWRRNTLVFIIFRHLFSLLVMDPWCFFHTHVMLWCSLESATSCLVRVSIYFFPFIPLILLTLRPLFFLLPSFNIFDVLFMCMKKEGCDFLSRVLELQYYCLFFLFVSCLSFTLFDASLSLSFNLEWMNDGIKWWWWSSIQVGTQGFILHFPSPSPRSTERRATSD